MNKKPIWFELALKLWNQGKSGSVICDVIAVQFGIFLMEKQLYGCRVRHSDQFIAKTREQISAAQSETHLRNRQLKNKHRTLAMKHMAQQERAKKPKG